MRDKQNLWQSLTVLCPKSPDDARIIHLSVHPSAWTGTPPATPQSHSGIATASQAQPGSQSAGRRDARSQPVPQTAGTLPHPLIVLKHAEAIHILTHGCFPTPRPELSSVPQMRSLAITTLQAYGYSWPTIFDEEYPPASEATEGVKYEPVTIEYVSSLSFQ